MSQTLVCLHGWGGTKESFTELRAALKGSGIHILTPDLPGFGAEPEPKEPWTTDDYVEWVEQWIAKEMTKKIDNGKLIIENYESKPSVWLLGHSHGGRIALKMACRQSQQFSILNSQFSISHLFLCAPAGIRHPRHFKRILGLTIAKTGKFFLAIPGLKALEPLGKKFLYKLVRVHDYEQASPVMRQTLINVTKEDLRPLLRTIAIPTDIFWGKDDGMVPFSDTLLMKDQIKDSTLFAFDGVRHRVHRDRAAEIATVIKSRLG